MNKTAALALTALVSAVATYVVLILLDVDNPWPATVLVTVLSILVAYWQSQKSK